VQTSITPKTGALLALNLPALSFGKVKSAAAGLVSTVLPAPSFDPTVDYLWSFTNR
jgi:hypothetical protein